VVLADDHELVRHALARVLEAEGLRVVAQTHAADEVPSIVAEHDPDVVVLDVAMGPIDGFEAARQIAHRAPGTPIVMLSARDDASAVDAAQRAGALGYVPKCAGTHELVRAIASAINGKPYVSPSVRAPDVRDAQRSALASLSGRERAIVDLVADGYASVQIGAHLGITPRTVDSHRSKIMEKLGVRTVAEIARIVERGT
jgi:DNA-binding NarL/FixJ family response regulator